MNTLSVIHDIDQRICPTVVQAGAYVTLEDYEDTLHQVVGKNQQLFTCLVSEYAGNRIRVLVFDSDSHSDTDIRRRRMIFRSCMTEFLMCNNLLSQHSVSDETVPNKTEVCNSDTKWM